MPRSLHQESGPRTPDVPIGVLAVAESQDGVISRPQLIACGMSVASIARAVRRHRLLRLHPTVYALGHRALTINGRLHAALLYAGDGAALSHTTAGWWWRFLDAEPRTIHLSAPVSRRRVSGIHVHRPRAVAPVLERGLPVTAVARTLLDLATTVDFSVLRRALAEADHLGMLEEGAIEAELGAGRAGSANLARALTIHMPELAPTGSELERRFLELLERSHVERPEVNVRVGRFRVDALWRAQRVVVELDGHRSHARAAAAERDRRRDLELRSAGYVVLRYTWQQVTRQPELVIADLRARLAAGAAGRAIA